MSADLHSTILSSLQQAASDARGRIDKKTGRFLAPNGGFAIAEQGVIYPLALLYAKPGTPSHQDPTLLEDVCRIGDAMRNFQNPDGSWEFIKSDGSTWGPTYMPWSILPWLETLRLLGDELGADRRQRWAEGLSIWCEGVSKEVGPGRTVHNIPAFNAVILIRAAQVLGLKQYDELAKAYLKRVAEDQNVQGYWAEGGVPTTVYNGVYNHALGLQYAFTKDPAILPVLRRSLDFHLHFTYPDGASVETIDGRVRYHKEPAIMGTMGFLPFPEGRQLTRLMAGRKCTSGHAGLDVYLALLMEHLGAEDETVPIPQTTDSYSSLFHERATVRRAGPWFVCLSGYIAPVESLIDRSRVRWLMDTQHLLSVWHASRGVVIGGGNAKNQPELCTFEVWVGGAHYRQPERTEVRSENGTDSIEAVYGPVRCRLRVRIDDRVILTFSAHSDDPRAKVKGGMVLPGVCDLEWACGSNAAKRLDAKTSVQVTCKEKHLPLRVGSAQLDLPIGAHFQYPVYPFNPYAIEGVAGKESTVASISFVLPVDGTEKSARIGIVS